MLLRPRIAQLVVFILFTGLYFPVAIFASKKKPPPQPINLNAATSNELQQVPGIGPSTAEKILQMRKSYGAFKKVDDLLAIKGIGKKRLDKMRKYLIAGKLAPKQSAQSTNKAVASPTKKPPQASPRPVKKESATPEEP